ncbi:MAG TPA: YeeE/YedE thiosulfate transporter family protein [Kofleriaceae bacterium]|nr:YeeE/YedE thiosulfate transporter family protein [Kofleriaceae bacterium]
MSTSLLTALAGGALIGLAAAIALVVHGRIAGISGILGRALEDGGVGFRIPFLFGLVGTGLVVALVAPALLGPSIASRPTLVVAGLLVGVGTTLANGCTSGHGVCGVARLSPRSLVAVGVFMATAMATVAIARHA